MAERTASTATPPSPSPRSLPPPPPPPLPLSPSRQDCFDHDTCLDHLGGSALGDNPDCGDEFDHAMDDCFASYGADCGCQSGPGPAPPESDLFDPCGLFPPCPGAADSAGARRKLAEAYARTGVPCGASTASEPLVDRAFVALVEGVSFCSYLPLEGCRPLAQAGQRFFTIGAGIDLHRWGAAALAALQVGPATLSQLQPILGLAGQEPDAAKRFQAAVAHCEEQGWSACVARLTPAEADALGVRVVDGLAQRLRAAYDADARNAPLVPLDTLRLGVRTAVYSVAHQLGDIWEDSESAPLPAAARRFWAQAVTQSWPAAMATLGGMVPEYGGRRSLEARAIELAFARVCSSAQCACDDAGGIGGGGASGSACVAQAAVAQVQSDVLFLADASGSIGSADFAKLRAALGRLVADWTINDANIRVGIMVFSFAAQMVYPSPARAPTRSPRPRLQKKNS